MQYRIGLNNISSEVKKDSLPVNGLLSSRYFYADHLVKVANPPPSFPLVLEFVLRILLVIV